MGYIDHISDASSSYDDSREVHLKIQFLSGLRKAASANGALACMEADKKLGRSKLVMDNIS